MSRACILLVNWNGWGDTIECLESIFRFVTSDVRVIVCDNDSTDGSVEKIQAWAEGRLDTVVPVDHPLRKISWPPLPKPIPLQIYDRLDAEDGVGGKGGARLVLIRTGGNLGFAGGNNVGLRYIMAQGREDYIWLLNNDTVIKPGTLEALLKRMKSDPNIGMCGSTLLRYNQPERVQARGGGWYCKWIGLPWHIGQLGRVGDKINVSRVEHWMNYVVGASLCVSRSFVEQVGLMNEDYFLFFEETDWAVRSKGRFRLSYAPESVVYHKVGKSIGTSSVPGQKSYTCDFYALRNRLKFSQRYYPIALPTIYLSLFCALLVRALYGKWDRVVLIWRILINSEKLSASGDMEPI